MIYYYQVVRSSGLERDHLLGKNRIEFKIHLLAYKGLNDHALSYLEDLRCLCSKTEGLFVVSRVFESRMGGRAFRY